jgi:putative DNA methylase
MTSTHKKLIEVCLPLEAINAACKADKERKTGHIRNVHKWFAPMPLPALRAILCATMLDAPEAEDARAALLDLIADLVVSGPDAPPNSVLQEAQRILQAGLRNDTIWVLDPFCGGGSTLVEAQRLGLNVEGSDLNPIPVLLSHTLTVITRRNRGRKPLHDPLFTGDNSDLSGFQTDIRAYADRIRETLDSRVGKLYPKAPNGDVVIYWWWAHMVPSPDPAFKHCRTPLVTSWWLSLSPRAEKFLVPEPNPKSGELNFHVESKGSPPSPTKTRCIFSGAPVTYRYVREQAHEGNLGRMLLAYVSDGPHGRKYWAADPIHVEAATVSEPDDLPNVAIPADGLGISVQNYNIQEWKDLFLPRQQRSLLSVVNAIHQVPAWVMADGGDESYGRDIACFLGLCLGKLAQASSSIVRVNVRKGMTAKAEPAFARGDIQLNWDFAETNPFGGSVGDWTQVVTTALRGFKLVDPIGAAVVAQTDVREAGTRHPGHYVVVTDPPYFAAIGYSDLSGYFYYWIRQALRETWPELFATLDVPRLGELIASPDRHGGKAAASEFFMNGFREALTHLASVSHPEFPIVVVYAQQQQERSNEREARTGWEAMLEAILTAGFGITGTWPIWGARSARMRGIESNALASYIVLVCRPQPPDLPTVSRRDFAAALRAGLPSALASLRDASVTPLDLAQAAIGPGMAIFSNYAKVIDAAGRPLSVREALSLIIQSLDDLGTDSEGEFDSDTRWAIAWFEQAGFGEGDYGIAEQLSKSKVTDVTKMAQAGILSSRAGKVRLFKPGELPADWDHDTDTRLTGWEIVHQLIRSLESGGEGAAAALVAKLGTKAEVARELAYRLYTVSERKKRAAEALSYNGLVQSWPEITRLARESATARPMQPQLI